MEFKFSLYVGDRNNSLAIFIQIAEEVRYFMKDLEESSKGKSLKLSSYELDNSVVCAVDMYTVRFYMEECPGKDSVFSKRVPDWIGQDMDESMSKDQKVKECMSRLVSYLGS